MADYEYQTHSRIPMHLLAGAGLVSMKWALLEGIVEDIMAGFLATDPGLVFAISGAVQIATRLEIVRTLAWLRLDDENDLSTFRAIITEIEELKGYRNYLIHALWGTTRYPEIARLFQIRSEKKLKERTAYVNACFLDWLAARIVASTIKLRDFGTARGIIHSPGTPEVE